MNLIRFSVWVTIASLVTSCVFGRILEPNGAKQKRQPGFKEVEARKMSPIQPDVIGGQPATLTQYPFYAQWWGNPAGTTQSIGVCGASLIHSDILLTAAHCNVISNNVNVVVGAYFSLNPLVGTLLTVTNRTIHINYNNVTFYNDLLVLKLSGPVTTQAVVLDNDGNSPYPNEQLTIVGMGQTNVNIEKLSPILMDVNVYAIAPTTCYNDYLSAGIKLNVNEQICTGVPGGGKGQCYGDSGGPVLNSQGTLVGVVSSGVLCAEANFPGVSSHVSYRHAWIRQQVCALSSYPPQYCYIPPLNPTNELPAPTIVRLDVFYNQYPTLTVVTVSNSSEVVFSTGAGPTSASNALVSHTLSLVPGFYYAGLIGNSFCCSNGFGFVAAFAVVNGLFQQILTPTSAFYYGTSEYIPMPVPLARSTPVSHTGSGIGIRVEVYYDSYPTETEFQVLNAQNQIVYSAPGWPNYADSLVAYSFSLPVGSFKIEFVDADGFCCSYGMGYFAIYMISNGSYQALVSPSYGIFSGTSSVEFTVP